MKSDLIIGKLYNAYEGGFNRGVIKSKAPRHSDCFVVYLLGQAEYIFCDYKLKISEGDAFFLAKDSVYDINVKEVSKYVCIDFDFQNTGEIRASEKFGKASIELNNKFLKYLHVKLGSKRENMPLAMSTLYDIYYECCKRSNSVYGKHNEFDKVLNFILENYTDPEISLERIVTSTGNSEITVRRMFKSILHTTPIKYINNLRFEKAKRMLEESNLSVSQIAFLAGFTDAFYFSRAFKKEFGLSPLSYRNK